MLMLMLLERIIYFVFVFRMLLPFYLFFHTRKGKLRDHEEFTQVASVATFAGGSLYVLPAP